MVPAPPPGSRLGGGSKPDVSRADRHVPLAESGRQLSSNPGFDPDTDPPSQDEAADTQQAASHAAVFGDRLRRMMGVQTEEAEPALTGTPSRCIPTRLCIRAGILPTVTLESPSRGFCLDFEAPAQISQSAALLCTVLVSLS